MCSLFRSQKVRAQASRAGGIPHYSSLMSHSISNERLLDPATRAEAFAQLVQQSSAGLYARIRRMVQWHDDADDVLQNTYLKAWTALDTFRGECAVTTWLTRIAINEALTFLNRQRPTTALDDEGCAEVRSLESDPYFDGDDTQRLLQEAIATLPPKQRVVFNLRYFDEMKYEQMSEALGTSVGALKASYHLAVKKIEQYFHDAE